MTENTTPTYQVGDRVRTAVHVTGDMSGPDIPVGSLGNAVDVYPDQFGFGQRVAVRLDIDGPNGLPVFYYAAELEPDPAELDD